MKTTKFLLHFLYIACAFQMATVFAQPSASDSQFVGGYRRGSVDTITELFILEDKTFCFAFTGGSADLTYAGRWNIQGKSIVLEEIKREEPMFPVAASNKPELNGQRKVQFTGRALAGDSSIIFGTSSNGKLPADMRPALPDGYNGFAQRYTVPNLIDLNTSIFLGFAVREVPGAPEGTLIYKVSQYTLNDPKFNIFTINFNREGMKPGLLFEGMMKDGELYISGSDNGKYGKNRPIPDKVLATVKQKCINPVLEKKGLAPLRTSTWLQTSSEQEVQLNLQGKQPIFTKDHKEPSDEVAQRSAGPVDKSEPIILMPNTIRKSTSEEKYPDNYQKK